MPLGQIAQKWENEDFFIYLERPDSEANERILNNMRFPAFIGAKQTVLANWCTAFSSCVTCKPDPSKESFPEKGTINISFTNNSQAKKVKMWGKWNNPKDLWELVDTETGDRYYYICKGNNK